MRDIARRTAPLFLLIVVLVLAGAIAVTADGLRDNARASDVGVVLGSKVMPDGTPSDRLRARLDKAADLYRQGMFGHIIVSGGTGVEGFSEAQVMGITWPSGRRFRAPSSSSTREAIRPRRRPATAPPSCGHRASGAR